MRQLSARIDSRLREVEGWWKLQRFLNWSIVLALCTTIGILSLGAAIVMGLITQPAWANGWLALLVIVSVVGLGGVALLSLGTPKETEWLAAALEKSRCDLEDRLNTLVYLQDRWDAQSRQISRELEGEVDRALRTAPSSCPFPWKQTLQRGLMCLSALLVTILFYQQFDPWDRLQAAVPVPPEEEVAELEIPDTPEPPEEEPVAEEDQVAWGEIRITEPGRDLKVTRLDLIPLQIEAATNRTLNRVEWVTLISDGPTEHHGLPAPEHPNYVVYRPSLLIEDYGLEEWDVISYYAEATTQEGTQFRSVEYFIQVVPPRPELEELPQPAYDSLEDITGLIEWQQEVIRETGRLSQLDELDDEDRARRHEELATQQKQIRQAAEHLSAKLASRFGVEPLDGLPERFESAEFALGDSWKTLEEQKSAEAVHNERAALGRLNAARKHFHQRVKQDPAAFDIAPEEQVTQNLQEISPEPLTPEELQQLQESLEERKQSLSESQDDLQQLIKRQGLIERQTKRAKDELWQELADKEQQLNEDLQQLAQETPQASKEFQSVADEAGQTLEQSQQALENQNPAQAEQQTAAATEQLRQMADVLESERTRVELAEQMLLEERLRRNREEYRHIEEQQQPRPSEDLQRTAQETQEIVEELDQLAQQEPTASEDESPSDLQQELTPEKKEQLAGNCNKMCQQSGASGQSETAGDIGSQLDKLSDALRKQIAPQLAGQGNQQLQQDLQQMQTGQDQLAQAREAVQKALREQTDIERSVPRSPQAQPQLSERQKQATDNLEQAMQENPQGFSQCQSESAGAKNAMRQSQRSLQSSNSLSRQRASEAAEELRRLDSALEKQQQMNRMADAYRQKQMLDRQIEQLKQFEQQPESISPSQCRSSGGACKKITGGMQQLMQEPGMAEAFGPKLQEALSEGNKQQIDRQSDQLADSQQPGEIESSAGELRKSLEKIARAFEAGQPGQGLAQRPGNSLKPSGRQALSEGLRRLESEAQRNQQGRPVPRQQSQQLREDALAHLTEGMIGEYGYNEQTRTVLTRWREDLQDPAFTVDQRVIQQLLRDIQQTRGEVVLNEKHSNQKPDVNTIDPSKYPSEYRPLIENYFQKLSEQP